MSLRNNLNRLYNFVCSEELVMSVGFAGGICWSILKSKENLNMFLYSPLTTLLFSSFDGIMYSICAGFVSSLFPYVIRPIIPISIIMSVCYHMNLLNNQNNQLIDQI